MSFFIALSFGILTSLVWLLFWLREDKKHPEPRKRLVIAFIGGMVAVLISLPLEQALGKVLPLGSLSLLISWVAVEEIVKYLSVRYTSLRHSFADEPVDMLVYCITAALGFSAFENALFLLTPLTDGTLYDVLITSNLRFVGATLLHTSASGVLGFMLALSFYKKQKIKLQYSLIGVILAIVLHGLFNFLILSVAPDHPLFLLGTFIFVWSIVAILIFAFEKAKRIKRFN